jgi:hypothetical protein
MKALNIKSSNPSICQMANCCMTIQPMEEMLMKKKKCCEKFKKKGKRCKGCPGRVD